MLYDVSAEIGPVLHAKRIGKPEPMPFRCRVQKILWWGAFDITFTLHKQNLLRPG